MRESGDGAIAQEHQLLSVLAILSAPHTSAVRVYRRRCRNRRSVQMCVFVHTFLMAVGSVLAILIPRKYMVGGRRALLIAAHTQFAAPSVEPLLSAPLSS